MDQATTHSDSTIPKAASFGGPTPLSLQDEPRTSTSDVEGWQTHSNRYTEGPVVFLLASASYIYSFGHLLVVGWL